MDKQGVMISNCFYKTLKINDLRPIVTTIGLVFFTTFAAAQRPPTDVGGNANSSPFDSTQQKETEIDTANISHFFAETPAVSTPENDSLLDRNFQQYDPTRHRALDFFHLGMPSTAAYPSVYQPVFRRGLDVGFHAFDIYQIRNADVPFYHQTKAFTDVFYSGAGQQNGLLNAKFGRQFANGISLSIEYRRVFNSNLTTLPIIGQRLFSSSGYSFDAARGRQVALGIGIWIHRERYDGYFTFTSNIANQLDRGGVDTTATVVSSGQYSSLAAFLTDAVTRHEKFEYSYLQYLKLTRRDSTGEKRNFLASHQITFRDANYRSSDPFTSAAPRHQDSLFYGSFLNDTRGLRVALRELTLENTFNLSTTKARAVRNAAYQKVQTDSLTINLKNNLPTDFKTIPTNNSTQADSLKTLRNSSAKSKNQIESVVNDWFEVGLVHQFSSINQELGAKTFNNLILRGRWNFTPNDNLKVETYAHFNIVGHNVGDYRLSGEAFLNWKNIGNLTLRAVNQLYAPTVVQSDLVVTQRQFWQTDFKKTLETNLSATLAVPRFGFSATVAYALLNNVVYFDTKAQPAQANAPLSILQLIVNQNFTVGHWHFDNSVALQKPTEKFLRLPDLYSKNSFYVEGKVFKKVMLARVGVDLRYASAWFAPSYMPLTGQFFVQETATAAAHPSLDVFLSLKVQSFRFFIKMENLLGDYVGSRYEQIFNNPTPEAIVRFGISWRLLN